MLAHWLWSCFSLMTGDSMFSFHLSFGHLCGHLWKTVQVLGPRFNQSLCYFLLLSCSPVLKNDFMYLSIYFWPCWVFVAAQTFLLLQGTGSSLQLMRRLLSFSLVGPGAHGLRSCDACAPEFRLLDVAQGCNGCAACGVFLDQGSSCVSRSGRWNSLPLSHQGSPGVPMLKINLFLDVWLASIFSHFVGCLFTLLFPLL